MWELNKPLYLWAGLPSSFTVSNSVWTISWIYEDLRSTVLYLFIAQLPPSHWHNYKPSRTVSGHLAKRVFFNPPRKLFQQWNITHSQPVIFFLRQYLNLIHIMYLKGERPHPERDSSFDGEQWATDANDSKCTDTQNCRCSLQPANRFGGR